MRRRHRSVAIAAGFLMAAWIGGTPPSQGGSDSREPERTPAEGPVAKLPEASPMQQFEADVHRTGLGAGSDSVGVGSGGGALVGSFWGAAWDPEKEAERRIKKLIRRLG